MDVILKMQSLVLFYWLVSSDRVIMLSHGWHVALLIVDHRSRKWVVFPKYIGNNDIEERWHDLQSNETIEMGSTLN